MDRNEEHWEWNRIGGVEGKQIDGFGWEENIDYEVGDGEVKKLDICDVDVDIGVEFEDEEEKHKKCWPWLPY